MQEDLSTVPAPSAQAMPPPAPRPGAKGLPGAHYVQMKVAKEFAPMPLESTKAAAGALQRVNYTHDGMIDLVLTNPAITKPEIARHFGRSPAWVSQIFNSDAFNERFAARKAQLIDPTIAASIDERMRAVTEQSLEILAQKLQDTQSADMALEVLKITPKALGYGAREDKVTLQQNFVVAMPAAVKNEQQWVEQVKGQIGGGV